MTQIFDNLIKPTTETVKGFPLFYGSQVLPIALGMSDFGRDYNLEYRDPNLSISIDEAVYEVLAGRLKLEEDVIARIESIHRDHQEVITEILQNASDKGFTYYTQDEVTAVLEKDSLLTLQVVKNLVAYSFSVMKTFYLKAISTDNFLGEINGKLNGLSLTYFDTKRVTFDNPSPYSSGFYLHRFFAPDGEIVSWQTGKYSGFVRGGKYNLIGGSVKAHKRYRDYPVETVLTRAKFFDNQTNDKYIDPL